MLGNGFIKLHRTLLNWEWYHDKNTCRLFLHLILTANYEDKKWQGQEIKRGQRVASYSSLADETDMTIREVRTALKHLITTGEVTSQSTSRYSTYTVFNYDKYQDVTCETTNERQASDKLTTNERQASDNNERKIKKDKESKKDKKDKEYIEKLSFDFAPSELIDCLTAYTEHRKEIKSPMTQRALELTVSKLERLAPNNFDEQKEILNESIQNGWKGVFPLKKGDQNENNARDTESTSGEDEPRFSHVINYDE